MSDDLVARLRAIRWPIALPDDTRSGPWTGSAELHAARSRRWTGSAELCHEAAAEIERLRAAIVTAKRECLRRPGC